MRVEEMIRDTLNKEISPTFLDVINESYLHKGHSGDDGSGETHFKVVISSETFNGVSKIVAHRVVYQALNPIMHRIHALSIDIR